MEWNDTFMTLFRNAVERYHEQPRTGADSFFLPDELQFLASIGYQPGEMHAYVQAYATSGDPSPSTVLLIANVRRTYFLVAQRGIMSKGRVVDDSKLPAPEDEFQEIPYLPRIIDKATAKLYGSLSPELMYYSPDDRKFLREHGNIHPADFLNMVWEARGDKQKMVKHVLNCMRSTQTPTQEPTQNELNLD